MQLSGGVCGVVLAARLKFGGGGGVVASFLAGRGVTGVQYCVYEYGVCL